jgi:hypothetical protein
MSGFDSDKPAGSSYLRGCFNQDADWEVVDVPVCVCACVIGVGAPIFRVDGGKEVVVDNVEVVAVWVGSSVVLAIVILIVIDVFARR